jgi:uncharacterized protein (TIGR03437 family)
VLRAWLALAVLFGGIARGAAPSYSVAGIVNTGNYAPGPFAPNAILTIFGTSLARSAQAIAPSDIKDNQLPIELNYTQVFVENSATPLFYVSDGQINFLLPSKLLAGSARIRVVREGISGPEVLVTVGDAAPALFITASGYAIATHADNTTVVSPDAPAHAGETIVIWATGLGKTVTNPGTGEIPQYASQLANLAELKVLLDGVAVDPARVLYAGLTPGSAGLYQINVTLPSSGSDPELRLTDGGQTTPNGVKLAIR